VRTWVPEIRKFKKLENVFQACTASEEDIKEAGLEGNPMVVDPIKRIEFNVELKPRNRRLRHSRKRVRGRRTGGGGNARDGEPDRDEAGERSDRA
jgi:deoxyribodipyrimidine photo-lyase